MNIDNIRSHELFVLLLLRPFIFLKNKLYNFMDLRYNKCMDDWNIASNLGITEGGCYGAVSFLEGGWALVAFVLGFLIAQIWKMISGMVMGRKTGVVDFKTAVGFFSKSGGMPSGHTASFTALTTYLGCLYGFGSGVFVLAAATLVVIMYDAIHVRYAVGEQGKVLNNMLRRAGKAELPIVEGHTLSQVLVGMMIGVFVGVGVYAIFVGF